MRGYWWERWKLQWRRMWCRNRWNRRVCLAEESRLKFPINITQSVHGPFRPGDYSRKLSLHIRYLSVGLLPGSLKLNVARFQCRYLLDKLMPLLHLCGLEQLKLLIGGVAKAQLVRLEFLCSCVKCVPCDAIYMFLEFCTCSGHSFGWIRHSFGYRWRESDLVTVEDSKD